MCYNKNMKKTLLLIGTLLLTAGSAFAYSMPRWGMTSIDVYLPEHGNSDMVRSVFDDWNRASGNRLKFRYQATRFAANNAPIRVEFKDENAPYYLTQSKRSETTGYFTNMDNGFISRASLTVYSRTRSGEVAPPEDLRKSITNEVGYILGLDKVYGLCEGEEASAMCLNQKGVTSGITQIDIDAITKKYTRTSEDIKERKNKQ